MFGQTMPEAEALQKVIHTKASKAEIKAALDKFIAATSCPHPKNKPSPKT